MKGTYLGEFEELIVLSVAAIAKEAYAVSIKAAIESDTQRTINISAVHSALYRLEDKGFLRSLLVLQPKQEVEKKRDYLK
ncbi:MAG: hypothetical protein WDN75_16385 [Bacteroidota bacterium]